MGALGSRVGRNVPLDHAYPDPDDRLLEPNPRRVSLELLTRKEFIPATTLNLLAGAWIQFEVHDWFSHGKGETENPWVVPLDDDPWPEHPMRIERTRRDPSADPDGPPTFVTDDTHWWDGSEVYDKARLVVAALMAKIHTTDWTPAIIAHPTTVKALRTNWWGLQGERLDKKLGRLTSNEVIRGIPGSPTALHGVPYSLTEEFVCVYRMHPLIPDDYSFRSLADDTLLQERTLPEVGVQHVRERLTEMSTADVLYSFGTSHPGAITLNNLDR